MAFAASRLVVVLAALAFVASPAHSQTPLLPASSPSDAPLTDSAPAAGEDWTSRLLEPTGGWERFETDVDLILDDYRNYYTGPNLAAVALGLAAAAPLANTFADGDVRDWYQGRIHPRSLNWLANTANYGGQLWVAVPICAEAAVIAGLADPGPVGDGGFREWSNRSLRAAAVGYPPVIALYFLLGPARPGEGDSHWRPFNDWHGVSGHTFIGAVPFLTAAMMTDDLRLQVPLVLGSFATGWSRIHKDEHYFSQVALGWWLAYLAVRSVDQTQTSWQNLTVAPAITPDGVGVSVLYRF